VTRSYRLIPPPRLLRQPLRLYIRPVLPLRIVDPIHQTRRTEAHIKLLVMQVVPFRKPRPEVIPRVHRSRLEQLHGQEYPERHHMTPQYHGWRRDGNYANQNMFPKGRVLRCQRDRRRKGMMRLVDRLINGRMVNEAVDIVNHDLPEEDAKDDISDNLRDAGQSSVESMSWRSTGQLVDSNYAQLQSR